MLVLPAVYKLVCPNRGRDAVLQEQSTAAPVPALLYFARYERHRERGEAGREGTQMHTDSLSTSLSLNRFLLCCCICACRAGATANLAAAADVRRICSAQADNTSCSHNGVSKGVQQRVHSVTATPVFFASVSYAPSSHSLSPASHCPAPLLIAHCRRLLQFGSLYGFLRCVFAYPVRDPKAPTPIASFTAEILRCVRHGRPSDAWALTAAHTNTQQHHTSTAAHTNTPFSRMRCSPFPHLPGSLTAGIQLRRFAHCTDCSVQRSQRCATVIRSQPLSTRDLQTPNGHSHTLTRSHTRSHTHTHSHFLSLSLSLSLFHTLLLIQCL